MRLSTCRQPGSKVGNEGTHQQFERAIQLSHGVCPSETYATSLAQRSEQCLSFLQVGGVKALGEPVVDLRQELSRFRPLALLPPEPGQAHGGPQFQRFGLLAASDLEGLLEVSFGLRMPRRPASQDEYSCQAVDL